MNLPNHIKAKRLRKKLTLRDLSRLTGISNQALSNYETGKSTPTFANLAKLCDALKIPVNRKLFE